MSGAHTAGRFEAIPLEDMKAACCGYSVVESRVWVDGVVGFIVNIINDKASP